MFILLWGSALVGLPAALFTTGIALAALRRYRSPSSSLIASAIGAVASGLYIFMIVCLFIRMYEAVILFAAIGAIASFILSLFLPKGSLKP